MDMSAINEEFGKETVGIVRRELTIKKGTSPSYIELYAELCKREGWNSIKAKEE